MTQASKTTKKNYKSTLNSLKKLLGGKLKDNINDVDKVIKTIENKYENSNTRRSYISRILTMIRQNPQWNIPKETHDKYAEIVKKYFQKNQEFLDKNIKTEKQIKNWLDWSEIVKVRNKLRKKAHDLKSFQDYLIVSLYTLIPPVRCDYGNMAVSIRPNKKSTNKVNYIIFCKTKKQFIFNVYKTANYYGQNIIEMPEDLIPVLYDWFDLYNTQMRWLLVNPSNPKYPMNSNTLCKRIIKIFKKETGKAVSVNILRHSFLTAFINKYYNVEDKKKVAKIMAHSLMRQMEYSKQEMKKNKER